MTYATLTIDRVVHMTDDAALFEIDHEQHWVPLSLIEDEDFEIGDTDIEVCVAEWFCEKEGIA